MTTFSHEEIKLGAILLLNKIEKGIVFTAEEFAHTGIDSLTLQEVRDFLKEIERMD